MCFINHFREVSNNKKKNDTKAVAGPVEDSHTVFVGNLSWNTTDEDLETHMKQAGKVIKATVQKRGNKSRGFGLVEVNIFIHLSLYILLW